MLYFDAKTDTKALTNLLLCQHVLLLPSDIVLSRSCEIASQVVVSLWNLTRGTTANLHKRRSNCRATGQLHLSQCLPSSYTMPPYDVTRDHRVNSLRPRRNRRHFADDIFKCIFLNENEWISLRFSLKFVNRVRINTIPSLVQIMTWRLPGDKPLSEPIMVSLLTYICVTRPQWVKMSFKIDTTPSLLL